MEMAVILPASKGMTAAFMGLAPTESLPKVEAAMRFVRANPGKRAIITSLDKALDALDGKTGTVISFA